MRPEVIEQISEMARAGEPFIFAVDYLGEEAFVKPLSRIDSDECLFDFNGFSNSRGLESSFVKEHEPKWVVTPPDYAAYERSFNFVKDNILRGNSYLVNLTCQAKVDCDISLREIFLRTEGKYKFYLNGRFACFSPEPFIRIKDGRIFSHPMKGTADALAPDAFAKLIADEKEAAEHATIVDLIRNDLSLVARNVEVDDYRYVETLQTNKGPILQTSSRISGLLPEGYERRMGEILASQLPAGSITGAPKPMTVKIISEAEGYRRGFYTGVMGVCHGGELDSAVMIRFVEQGSDGLIFKAGGGITAKSDCLKEYNEVLKKIYLPLRR